MNTPPIHLTLGFSPCPNDCFIFDALIHHKIDTEGISFEWYLEDVETLNKRAFSALDENSTSSLHITKLSYHAYAYLATPYVLLDSGSALGNNCGPLLISKKPLNESDLLNAHIAIPGKYTTANFLCSLAFPKAQKKTEIVFSEIENAVLSGAVDAGLIIHENRFTYEAKGLKKIIDLGEFWESQTAMPIPLGGIVVQRNLPQALKLKVNRLIHKSIAYAFEHPNSSADFVAQHAQEMSEEVRNKHINLYVTKYSLNLGEKGRAAVELLFQRAQALGIISNIDKSLFLS